MDALFYCTHTTGKTPRTYSSRGLVLIAAGFGSLSIANHAWLVALGLALNGIGFGIIRPNLVVWLFSFTPPPQRGLRIGSLTRWYFIDQVTCVLLIEPLIKLLGYAGCYLLFASITLLLSLLLTTNTARAHQNNATSPAQQD